MATETITDTIDDFARRKAKYDPVAAILSITYGHLEWRKSQSGMDELVSCILSQNTNDTNRDRAFSALKADYPAWEDVASAPPDDLIDTIRSAGLANQKGPRIQAALEQIKAERGAYNIDFLADMPVDEAKSWLTHINGIGPKTAAIVLCFAYNRPAFPVDTHVHRVGKRIGFLPGNISAEKAHPVMEAIAPPQDYYAFHIHLIQHGRAICHARNPECARCPLTEHCDFYVDVVKDNEK